MKTPIITFLAVLAFLTVLPASAEAPKTPARLCNNCAFGTKAENCVKCGKWAPKYYVVAPLCSNCAFGTKKENCVKCGKWAPNNYKPARLCNDCAFGNKKHNCVKCGKYVP